MQTRNIGPTQVAKPSRRMKQSRALSDPAVTQQLISAAANLAEDEGKELATQLASDLYTVEHGAEISKLEAQAADLAADIKRIDKERAGVQDVLNCTPEWTSTAELNDSWHKKKPQTVPFLSWQMRHIAEGTLMFIGAIAVLLTSLLTTHASLVASGNTAFIESPLLPWCMAAIAPTASIAIKVIGSVFRMPRPREIYRISVYVLSALSFVVWLWIFSDLFHGLSGSIDIFGNHDGHAERLFVAIQLATEVLVGAALFLRLDTISQNYAPNYYCPHPEHAIAAARRDKLDAKRGPLAKQHAELVAKMDTYRAGRNVNVAAAILALNRQRDRYGADL